MKQTLLDKIWDAHTVRVEDGGRCVLYIDRQYIHEVTSPVAFGGIERRGFGVARPAQITATADHNNPTVNQHLPIEEPESRRQVEALAENCAHCFGRIQQHGCISVGLACVQSDGNALVLCNLKKTRE